MNILFIIPARGGSKGIPRKNIRPLNGKPLIYYSIENAKKSSFKPEILVTTDDDEIEFYSKKFGAIVHRRKLNLADDKTTLDPVIIDAFYNHLKNSNKKYDFVVTLQPTSPCLKTESIDSAIRNAQNNTKIDTIISVVEDKHLTWKSINNDLALPNYKKRVNRQDLPETYKETGGFVISKIIKNNFEKRIRGNIQIQKISYEEAIDIDNFSDWSVCEYLLKRRRIVINVSGNIKIGLGHVYNTLLIASQILNHEIIFIVDSHSDLAYKKIKEYNFVVYKQKNIDLIEDIKILRPDLVINDCLDTSIKFITDLKKLKCKVINFEDLGAGSKFADVVVNPIYKQKNKIKSHYFGHKYFSIRDEFFHHPEKKICKKVQNILITFGGTDPNNFSYKVLSSIYDFCINENIIIHVIAGIGYTKYETLKKFPKIYIHKNVKNISDYIFNSDIVFSACGRTVYEIAFVGIPSIVMAQNIRELSHYFAYEEQGFVNLGLGTKCTKKQILNSFKNLCFDYDQRKKISKKMRSFDIRNGKERIITIINKTLK